MGVQGLTMDAKSSKSKKKGTFLEESSVHSTVAGLGRMEPPISQNPLGTLRPNRSSFGSFGKMRRSLPKRIGSIGKSLSMKNFGKTEGSATSLSSNKSHDDQTQLEQGVEAPHRTYSKAQRLGVMKCQVEQYDNGVISFAVAQAAGRKDQDRYDARLADDNPKNMHYFGVFDGHGTSALAADMCVDHLYDAINCYQPPTPSASTSTLDMEDGKGNSEESGDENGGASSGPDEPEQLGRAKSPSSSSSPGSRSFHSSTDEGENASDGAVSTEGEEEDLSSSNHHIPYPLPSDDAISYGYNKVDELVRASRHAEPRAGTCAVTLMVDQETPGNLIDETEEENLRGKVAWVGDCRCFMIDQDNKITKLTKDHRIDDNEAEHRRILEAPHHPRPGLLESELWKREKDRASKQPGGAERLRAHSFVGRRELNGVETGPRCVFSHTGGVSLQVTRSIGDAYAARSVIADPEITEFSIPRGQHVRFVLGSDGIFDVMSEEDIAKFISRIASPAKAAQKLAVNAKQKRLYSGFASDDITVMVVDLNPDMRSKKGGSAFGMFK